MTACPNCGRQTLRTSDWACQWCGYPLISRAFKKIDKTFKECQEERNLGPLAADSDLDAEPAEPEYEAEAEDDLEPEPEPEPERKPDKKANRKKERRPEPEKKPKFRFFRKPEPTQPRPAPESARESEYRPPERPVTRPQPVQRPAPPPPVYKPAPAPQTPPVQKPVEPAKPVYIAPPPVRQELPPPPVQHTAPTAPVFKPEPVPEPKPAAARPPAPPPPAPKPEIVVEAQPAPVSAVKPDDIKEGMEISVDDIDALFRADKAGTNIKLNGKTVIIKGLVEKVFVKEHLDIRYIVVKGARRGVWSARCTFNKDTAGKAARLNEGEAVAVRAKYDGYGKNIIFKDCEVV